MTGVLFICVLVFLLATFVGITEWCMNRTDQARLDLETDKLHREFREWRAEDVDAVWSDRRAA